MFIERWMHVPDCLNDKFLRILPCVKVAVYVTMMFEIIPVRKRSRTIRIGDERRLTSNNTKTTQTHSHMPLFGAFRKLKGREYLE